MLADPFPHVARQVEDAVGARARGMVSGRGRARRLGTAAEDGPCRIRCRIPPRIQASVVAARSLFPLRLGRQPRAQPVAKRRGVGRVDPRHGMSAGSCGHLAVVPVQRSTVARLTYESGVLVVRDRGQRDLESRQLEGRLGQLVGGECLTATNDRVAPDQAAATRDVDEVVSACRRPERSRGGTRRRGRWRPGAARDGSRSERPRRRGCTSRRERPEARGRTDPRGRRRPPTGTGGRCSTPTRPRFRPCRARRRGQQRPAVGPPARARRCRAPKTARSPSGGTSPQGQSRPSPPVAAASHSASVGSLPPAQSANARASCQET